MAGTFIKGGRFPDRREARMVARASTAVSALALPAQDRAVWRLDSSGMISGRSAEEFYAVARTVLPQRILHEIMRSLAR